jgi:hypothetical protein
MDTSSTIVKFLFNINEEIISNNMMLFTKCSDIMIDDFDKDSDGIAILDIENITTPQQGLIYNIIKSITDLHNIDLNEYHIVFRSSIKYGKEGYDLYSDYGELHNIIKSDGSIERDFGDFHIVINYNDSDNILNIMSDLTKDNREECPQINELTFFRPLKLSACMSTHYTTYYLTDEKYELYKTYIDFIKKNRGNVHYTDVSDIIKTEEQLYEEYDNGNSNIFSEHKDFFVNNTIDQKLENIELIGSVLDKNSRSCTNDTIIRNILESYNYTFEKLYKSMYPCQYCDEGFDICDYSDCNIDHPHVDTNDINVIHDNYACIGMKIVPEDTRKIIKEIANYMKLNNYYTMTITK